MYCVRKLENEDEVASLFGERFGERMAVRVVVCAGGVLHVLRGNVSFNWPIRRPTFREF